MESRESPSDAQASRAETNGVHAAPVCTVCGAAPATPTGEVDPDLGPVAFCERHRGTREGFDYT